MLEEAAGGGVTGEERRHRRRKISLKKTFNTRKGKEWKLMELGLK